MRDAMIRVTLLAAAAGLSACGATVDGPSPLPTPSGSAAQTVAPTSIPPLESVPEPTPSEAAPSLELAPTGSLSAVPQPSPQGGPWAAVTESLETPAEAAAATSLPESFRAFLGARLGYADETGCVTTGVDVRGVHADGFVFGDEFTSCGDSRTVWGITEGRWHYIVAFQDAMPCRDLAQNDIPPGVPGLRCVDDDGGATDY